MTPLSRRLCYGGIRFELLGELPPDGRAAEHIHAASGIGVADVYCSVFRDPSLARNPFARQLAAEPFQDGVRVDTSCTRASVLCTGTNRFAATVRIGSDDLDDLLTPVVAAVAELGRGLVLHAASVELDGQVYAYVGPSGAGKTTAVGLTEDAGWYSRDRLVLHPHRGEWWAWPLAGGSDVPDLPRSLEHALPLAAVLRVRHGRAVETKKSSAATAALLVRESMMAPHKPGAGGRLTSALDRALQLTHDVFVGEIHTVLGESIPSALLRELSHRKNV